MSDEDDFMPSADEEDFDFGVYGSSDSSGTELKDHEMDGESRYYTAKSLKREDTERARQEFHSLAYTVPACELSIKALKQYIKLSARQKQIDDVEKSFKDLLSQLMTVKVLASYRDKSISNVLSHIRNIFECDSRLDMLIRLHLEAIERIANAPNQERLMQRTRLELARLYFAKKELKKSLDMLACFDFDDDSYQSTQKLEASALGIRIEMELQTGKEEQLYLKARDMSTQLAYPEVLGTINECGGILALRRKQWSEARDLLLRSFESYDEAGVADRLRVLRYYILACLLTESGLNPFDSQETMAYKDTPELQGLAELVYAFLAVDIKRFSKVLSFNAEDFAQDPLITSIIRTVEELFKTQALIKLIEPYSSVRYEFLAEQLQFDEPTLLKLLTQLILDQRLSKVRMDDFNRALVIGSEDIKFPEGVTGTLPMPERYKERSAAKQQKAEEQDIISKPAWSMEEQPRSYAARISGLLSCSLKF